MAGDSELITKVQLTRISQLIYTLLRRPRVSRLGVNMRAACFSDYYSVVLLFAGGRFDLPEERTIVNLLVERGYAVVAPASKNRESG